MVTRRLAFFLLLTAGATAAGCAKPEAEPAQADAAPKQPELTATPASVSHIEAGKQLLDQGKYDEAIQHFTQALAIGGDQSALVDTNPVEADVYFQRGLAYLKGGFPDTAVEDFSAVIHLAPKYAPAYEYRGESNSQIGDSYNALRDATEAIRLDPDNAHAYQVRGNVYLGRTQYDRATADLEKALQLDPSRADQVRPQLAEALHGWSEQLADDGAAEAAALHMAKALELIPALAVADAAAEGDLVEQTAAKPVIDEAVEKVAAARARLAAGRGDEAVILLSEAIALDPAQSESYLRRGEALLAMGFPDTALEDFSAAINRGGEYGETYRLQARAFLKLKSPYRAMLAATESLHLDPAVAETYVVRGGAYMELRRWDRALADLEEAVRRRPALADSLAPALDEARQQVAASDAELMEPDAAALPEAEQETPAT